MTQAGKNIAVVTGAASGMGEAAARLMSAAGWPLLLCDLNADTLKAKAEELRGGGPIETLAGDISAPGFGDDLAAALAGRPIGGLIHCAGLSPSMGDPARILEVNLAATMRLVSTVRPLMAQGAAAVLFASTAGHMLGAMLDEPIGAVTKPEGVSALTAYTPNAGAAYSVSKRGVMLLVKREAAAFGRQGARLVSVSPGIIDTPMARTEFQVEPSMRQMVETTPLPRMGRPEEVAGVAVFLCSPAAGFVSGTDVLVDGGSMSVLLSGQTQPRASA